MKKNNLGTVIPGPQIIFTYVLPSQGRLFGLYAFSFIGYKFIFVLN